MSRAPWDQGRLQLSPEGFELLVVEFLRNLDGRLTEFSVTHKEVLAGPDGEFEIDAVARFQALGAQFKVLVECKHHTNPIKRELVQVLRDKVRSLHAQKGMLFATAPFQSGAIEYSENQGIALVHFTPGGAVYESRSFGMSSGPTRTSDAYWVGLSETGKRLYRCGSWAELSQYLFAPQVAKNGA